MKEYFYWLGVPIEEAKKGSMLTAEVNGNTITIHDCDYSKVRIYLNEKLVDLSKPVVVLHVDDNLFEGTLRKSDSLMKKTLYQRNDPSYSFPCVIEIGL